jgi:hypothetical protein
MTKTIQRHQMPILDRSASFVPETLNAEDRTVEVVWSTGARVRRSSWFSGDYHEELSMQHSHVRLDRLNSGASVLNNHARYSLSDVIGVVEKAWIKEKTGHATIRFSNREDVEPIFNDVKNGIIRNISVGYTVHKFEERQPGDDGLKVFRAIDWEPMELSFVAIPADKGAQVRSEELSTSCEIVHRQEEQPQGETEMPQAQAQTPSNVAPETNVREVQTPVVDTDAIRNEAVQAERVRCSEIKKIVTAVRLESDVADQLIASGVSIEEARKAVLEKVAAKQAEVRTTNVDVTRDENETRLRGFENALLNRYDGKNKLEDHGRKVRSFSLLDMARECVERKGVRTAEMSRMEIAGRALHSTSDFPLILANVAGKTMRDSYEAAPKTFAPFVRETTLPDFKEISRVQIGDAPELDEIVENAAVTYGTVGEAAEKYALRTFGKGIAIGRRMIVNDDMDAFSRIPALFGRRAADKEADLVWGIITGNPNMADGYALFQAANHKNLASSGAVISVTTVSAARKAMRLQTGLNGAKMNLRPAFMAVPTALETTAEQFLNSIIVATQDSNTNPFKGSMGLIVEPRLDDASATAWYLLCTPAQVDMIELGRLQGETGPMLETESDFDTEGFKMKMRYDLGSKAIDHRGFFKNPGA